MLSKHVLWDDATATAEQNLYLKSYESTKSKYPHKCQQKCTKSNAFLHAFFAGLNTRPISVEWLNRLYFN